MSLYIRLGHELTDVFRLFAGEIDRCLKKVQEGVDAFEEIWKKVCFNSTVQAAWCFCLYSCKY